MTVGGIAVSVVVLIMVLASVTLLPAFLGARRPLDQPASDCRDDRPPDGAPRAARRWERWGRHVSAHAAAYAIGTTALLLALAAPLLALRVGTARRRGAAPTPDRAPGLRPRGRGLRARRQRSPGRCRGHLARPARGGSDRRCGPGGRGSREGRCRARRSPPGSRPWSSSRPPDPRTTPRSRPSPGCAPTCSPPRSATARHVPTSAGRRRAFADVGGRVSRTGCRTSSAPWSCCRSCSWWWCSGRSWCRSRRHCSTC